MMTDQFECVFVTGFRQDQENLLYLMLSIIIENEDFEDASVTGWGN
jgi:hypothetical protein